jgi:hypothetical protein
LFLNMMSAVFLLYFWTRTSLQTKHDVG